MEQKKKIKIIIIVPAVLLGISLAAFGGTLIYNKQQNSKRHPCHRDRAG